MSLAKEAAIRTFRPGRFKLKKLRQQVSPSSGASLPKPLPRILGKKPGSEEPAFLG